MRLGVKIKTPSTVGRTTGEGEQLFGARGAKETACVRACWWLLGHDEAAEAAGVGDEPR